METGTEVTVHNPLLRKVMGWLILAAVFVGFYFILPFPTFVIVVLWMFVVGPLVTGWLNKQEEKKKNK